MKKVLVFCMLFCLTAAEPMVRSLLAEDSASSKEFFVGIGPEVNAYTRDGAAIGGSLVLGMDINRQFAAGIRSGFFHDTETISTWDVQGFFRYYLPFLHNPDSASGPFVQAEIGAAIAFESPCPFCENSDCGEEVNPSFSAVGTVGWRFNLPQNFYVEPALRFGLPHAWAIMTTVGLRFSVSGKSGAEEPVARRRAPAAPAAADVMEEIRGQLGDNLIDGIDLVLDADGNLRLLVTGLVFRADNADFVGLAANVVANNRAVIAQVAEILKTYTAFDIIIEGHSNPLSAPGAARDNQEPGLRQLSEQRAQRIIQELAALGVAEGRMRAVGRGTSMNVVAYNAPDNWRNRRVEFILIPRNR